MSDREIPNSTPGASPPGLWGKPIYRVILLVLLAVGAIATTGLVVAKWPSHAKELPKGGQPGSEAPTKEFTEFAGKHLPSWPAGKKPELVILFTGQQHNYEAPCGCTEPQYGGLERRYNFFKQLRDFGIKTVALDLGDIYFPGKIADQAKLKYVLSMKALAVMDYDAITVGPQEFRIQLIDALGETILNWKVPYEVVLANLADKEANYPGANGSMIKDFKVIEPKDGKLKVGVSGAIGTAAADTIRKADPMIKFERNPAALAAMKAKEPDLKVLLFQGSTEEAKVLAQESDEFDVILCRSEESEPPGEIKYAPPAVGKQQRPKARLVHVGQKGRLVGVMGVFRNADDTLDLRWELVKLAPEFKTPADQQPEHPIVKLLEAYTKKMKDDDFLARLVPATHPLQAQFTNPIPKFIGSEACKKCHAAEFEKWNESRHAAGYETLSEHPKAKPPHNRQFDAECVVCHTTGFGYKSGFRDHASGYTIAEKAKHLWGVGCETCHGPGSLHADKPDNKGFRAALSPWKENPKDYLTLQAIKDDKTEKERKAVPPAEQAMSDRVFKFCFQCHDTDNDHDFALEKRWKAIAHGPGPTVKKEK